MASACRSHADERHHRHQLEDENQSEQGELQSEEAVVPIETRFLPAEEHASETRGDPQSGGDAPNVVSGEQPLPTRLIERTSERAAAHENGPKPESERQDVDRGEQRTDDHDAVYLAVTPSS